MCFKTRFEIAQFVKVSDGPSLFCWHIFAVSILSENWEQQLEAFALYIFSQRFTNCQAKLFVLLFHFEIPVCHVVVFQSIGSPLSCSYMQSSQQECFGVIFQNRCYTNIVALHITLHCWWVREFCRKRQRSDEPDFDQSLPISKRINQLHIR